MRVLFLSTLYNGGGAERVARELFNAMPSMGIEAKMYVARRSPGDPDSVRALRLPGERYLRVFDFGQPMRDWRFIGSRMALRDISQKDFDLVHLHNPHGGWISMQALHDLSLRVPLVWSLHDEFIVSGMAYDLTRVLPVAEIRKRWPGNPWLDPENPPVRRYKQAVMSHLPQAAALVSHGDYVYSLVQQEARWKQTPLHRVRCGVSLLDHPACQMDRAAARERRGLKIDEPIVALVAHDLSSPYKGMPWAIEALKQLAGECTVLVAGRGGEQIRQLVPQKTVCTGFLSDPADLAAAYRAADVLLLPSIAEAFGLVGAEAMACGTPVVGFRTSGLIELVGDNERGLLAAPLNTTELAANLSALLKDRERARHLGQAGERWVRQNCGLADSVRAIVRVYNEVLNRQKGQPATAAAQGSSI